MGIYKIFHSAPDMVSTLNPQSMHRKRLCTCIQAPQWFLPPPPPQGIASPPGPQVSPGTPKLECLHLKRRVRVPKQMIFWKGSKGWGGEGVIFNPKIYNADFGPLNRALKKAFSKKIAI